MIKNISLNLLSLLLVLIITIPAAAQEYPAAPRIEKDGSVLLNKNLQAKRIDNLRGSAQFNSPAWKDFCKKNGNWSGTFNRLTNTPHDAIGKSIKIDGYDHITDSNIELAAMSFIKENAKVLNVNPDNLKLKKKVYANKRWYISYIQIYNGYEVLLSEVKLRIFNNGKVMAFGSDYYNDISLPNSAFLQMDEILTSAVQGVEYNLKAYTPLSAKTMYVLPIIGTNSITYRLVYKISFSSDMPLGKYVSFVDAVDGTLHWRINTVKDAQTVINVSGSIKPKTPVDSEVLTAFPSIYVNVNNTDYTSDINGNVNVDIADSATVKVSMSGPIARVSWIDKPYDTHVTSKVYTGMPLNIVIDDINSEIDSRMLFYHANAQYQYLKQLDSELAVNEMNFTLGVGILWGNYGPYTTPNAMSMGDSILFIVVKDPTYRMAQTPSILHHEYGHSVNKYLYDKVNQDSLGMINSACNEGTADVFAALMLDDSRVGWGSKTSDSSASIRNIDDNNIYPDSVIGESHHDGEILSGAFWDLRKLLGIDEARHLAHYCKYGTPDNVDFGIACSEWFIETLIADDDDGDLSNGTPHFNEIITSFNKHQIGTGLLKSLAFSHTPVEDTKDTINDYLVDFSFDISSNFILYSLDSVSVIWSNDRFNTSHIIKAFKDANHYWAFIPAQKAGTQVSYYISTIDSISRQKNNYKSYPYNKPYSFLVGFNELIKNDFEINPNWSTKDSKQDNATQGLWEWGMPAFIQYPYSNPKLTIQTDSCYSGENCYVTGKDGTSNNFQKSEPNGITTLTSNVFDISAFKIPVLRYYRWFFIIDFDTIPSIFRTDISSDGGNTWVNCDTLENTTNYWQEVTIFINDYIVTTNLFKVRFVVDNKRYHQTTTYNYCEALVDDVIILSPSDIPLDVRDDNISNKAPVSVYPNPASDLVTFTFSNNDGNPVIIRIYDVLGNNVFVDKDITDPSTTFSFNWDLTGLNGEKLPSGVYFYQIMQSGKSYNGKILIN